MEIIYKKYFRKVYEHFPFLFDEKIRGEFKKEREFAVQDRDGFFRMAITIPVDGISEIDPEMINVGENGKVSLFDVDKYDSQHLMERKNGVFDRERVIYLS